LTQTAPLLSGSRQPLGALDAFFILSLILAETYAFVILFLDTFRPSGRCAARRWRCLSQRKNAARRRSDSHLQRAADVVRYTALGALNMDWPADKMHVYLLDDGRRKEFEQFAFEAGIGYKIRPDNFHAKAGNINTRPQKHKLALRDHLRLRSRAHAQLSANDGWLDDSRSQPSHVADAPPLLFARSV